MRKCDEYERYLKSTTWRRLSGERLKIDRHKCRMCAAPAEVVHHPEYPEVLGTETVDDLTSLCHRCHRNFHFPPSVDEVSEQFMAMAHGKGGVCAVCHRFGMVYPRPMTWAMAVGLKLIKGYFDKPRHDEWLHIEDYLKSIPNLKSSVRGDISKLRFFGLLEKAEGNRDDGSPRNGYARPTDKAKPFLEGKLLVPKYVYIYNDELIRVSEETIDVYTALAKGYNYRDQMALAGF